MQSSGFRFQVSGFRFQVSSLIPHPSSLIPHPSGEADQGVLDGPRLAGLLNMRGKEIETAIINGIRQSFIVKMKKIMCEVSNLKFEVSYGTLGRLRDET